MKKAMSIASIIALMMVMCIPASAAENHIGVPDSTFDQVRVETLAYMELEQADIETREKIIEAREEIIFSQDWVVDGIIGYVVDESGNITEKVPCFSELFPDDWDVPNINSWGIGQPSEVTMKLDSGGVTSYYNNSLELSVPAGDTNTPAFCYAATSGNGWHLTSLGTFGRITHSGSPKFNVGYANATTGASLGWKENIANDNGFVITNLPANIDVAVRASTYNAPGEWWIETFGNFDYD